MEGRINLYMVATFFWVITICLIITSFFVMQSIVVASIGAIITAVITFVLGCFSAIRAELTQAAPESEKRRRFTVFSK